MPSRKNKAQELLRFSGQLTQKRTPLVIGWRDGDAPAEQGVVRLEGPAVPVEIGMLSHWKWASCLIA